MLFAAFLPVLFDRNDLAQTQTYLIEKGWSSKQLQLSYIVIPDYIMYQPPSNTACQPQNSSTKAWDCVHPQNPLVN